MSSKKTALSSIGAMFLLTNLGLADPVGTAFTWQGHLTDSGNPATGLYDLQFTLFNSLTNGVALGTNAVSAVPVTNGLYNVFLDFGSGPFGGDARWLALSVRTNGALAWTALAPRFHVTPTPYALFSTTAGGVSGIVADNQLSTNIARLNGSNTFTGPINFTGPVAVGNSNQVPNLNAQYLGGFCPSAFWQLGGNNGTIVGTNFLGTSDNSPIELRVNNQRAFRLEPGLNAPNVVGGYLGNSVASGVEAAVIAGGGTALFQPGTPPQPNQINGSYSFIGGGFGNFIDPDSATIVGGRKSAIETGAIGSFVGGGGEHVIQQGAHSSTIAGGGGSVIGTNAIYATIAGGLQNSVLGDAAYATIGGGLQNTVGPGATVPGGRDNAAVGAFSLAAGHRAKAMSNGSFVWADSADADFADTGTDQFLIRATGGVGIGTTTPQSALHVSGDYLHGGLTLQSAETNIVFLSPHTGYTYNNEFLDVLTPSYAGAGVKAGGVLVADDYGFADPDRNSLIVKGSVGVGTSTPNVPLLVLRQGAQPASIVAGIGDQVTPTANATIVSMTTSSSAYRLFAGYENGGEVFNVGNDGGGFFNGSVGIGTSSPTTKLEVVGNLKVSGTGNSITTPVLSITGGSDVAEPFPISGTEAPQGAVVIIDDAHPGKLKLSDRAYDKRVAGVVSGAGGVNPGLTLNQQDVLGCGQNVALTGRVYVLADASNSPIEPGDLLTTSATPGHAMKASDVTGAQGAILGKAMSSLQSGQGLVLVLVTLQ